MLLSHLHVVDVGSVATPACCARLLADFGASIGKIGPPAGDLIRKVAPLAPAGESAFVACRNATRNKRAGG